LYTNINYKKLFTYVHDKYFPLFPKILNTLALLPSSQFFLDAS
jgi:hypothetical protein